MSQVLVLILVLASLVLVVVLVLVGLVLVLVLVLVLACPVLVNITGSFHCCRCTTQVGLLNLTALPCS